MTQKMKKAITCIMSAAAVLLTACGYKDVDYDASGVFETTEVIVSARGTGEIMSLNVEAGEHVPANEPLGEIAVTQLARFMKSYPATANVPVIFCTAKDSEEDMIKGLDMGADD